jgi:hypothetical protein
MGITLGGIGAAVGGGSALASLLGFGAQQPQAPSPAYMPQNLPGADAGAYGGIQGLNPTIAGATGAAGQIANNPFASSYQSNAGAVGAAGMGAGANILGTAQSYLPYAQQTLQTAYDPQNALYAQQYQANNDAVNASLSSRGLGTTPYGAGVQSTSDQQFNTNWLQTQLQRQATGAQTAGSLLNSAGTGSTTGLNLATAGAALPYQTANTIGQNSLSAYGTLAGIQNPQIADYLQYLGLGNQTAGVNNQNYANQITAQQNQFNQQQMLGQNLGKSISGLGTAYGGSGGTVAPFSSSGSPVQYTNVGGYSMPTYGQ